MSLMNPRLFQMNHGVYYVEFARGIRTSLRTRIYEEAETKYKKLRERFVMELAHKIINSPVEVKKFIDPIKFDGPGYVYFLQTFPSGLIKIGFSASSNIDIRINTLKNLSGHKVVLLKKIYGSFKKERQLHIKFADYRKHGEWFEPSPELLDYIATVRETE